MIAFLCRNTLSCLVLCESGILALGGSANCYQKFPKVRKCVSFIENIIKTFISVSFFSILISLQFFFQIFFFFFYLQKQNFGQKIILNCKNAVIIVITVTSGEWSCPLNNDPKLSMGQPSSKLKIKDLEMKIMIKPFSEAGYYFLFRVKRRSEVVVNKGFSARNEYPEVKRPNF